jgi:release factor glutamine methyltransferase
MVYSPQEDSYFLSQVVENYLSKLSTKLKDKLKILDVGTGSGIQSKNLLSLEIKKSKIVAIDLNLDTLKNTKKLGIKSIQSDLFSNIDQKFDLIIFNPPYLPKEKFDSELDTTGGKNGDETIIKFITQLPKHLTKKGICFLLTSSFTPEKKWKSEAKKLNLLFKKIAEKNLFFEKLFIWEITQPQ